VDSWIWDQVGLELSNIDIQGSVESQRSSQRRDNLGNKSIKVSMGWSFDIQVSSADIINGLIVQHDGNVSVLQKGVSGQDGIVRLNNSS
jgi:hypothetical protein